MPAPTSENLVESASNSQAESSTAMQAGDVGVEAASASGPRRGARNRKPTSKAAGLEPTEAALRAAPRTSRKRKADDLNAEQTQAASGPDADADADRINKEVNEVFDAAEDGDEDDDDEKQYCICRGKDDGTFMISCEQCQEW